MDIRQDIHTGSRQTPLTAYLTHTQKRNSVKRLHTFYKVYMHRQKGQIQGQHHSLNSYTKSPPQSSSPSSQTVGSILCLPALCVNAVCTACEHNAVIVAGVPFSLPMLRMSQPEPAPDAYISHNEAGGLDRRLGRVGDTMYTAALGI